MSSYKKIVLVANTSWYLYNYKYTIMEKLANNGYKVYAVAPYDSYTSRLKELDIKYINISISRSRFTPYKDLLVIFRLKQIYNRIKPDIIHHFTIKPVIYGSMVRYKWGAIVNTIPGLGYSFSKRGVFYFLVKFLYRFAIQDEYRVIFQNEDDYELFKSLRIVKDTQSTIIFGSGIDIDKFDSKKNNREDSKVCFGLITRLLWSKGIKEFINASIKLHKKFSNIRVVIIGSSDKGNPDCLSEDWLIENIDMYPFIKWIEHTDNIIGELKKLDVFVYPSYYKEGIPRAVLEAAAMRLPIIISDISAANKLVSDGENGYIVKKKSTNSLYEKMCILAQSSNRVDMGNNSRKKIVGKFDSSVIDSSVLQFYKNL